MLLSAGAVLLVHRIFAATATGVRSLQRQLASANDHYNGNRWLEDALSSMTVGGPADAPFEGRPERLTGTTRVAVAQGWQESVPVSLSQEGTTVALRLGDLSVTIVRHVKALRLDYLGARGLRADWMAGWQSPVSAPLALRMRVTRMDGMVDTSLFLIRGAF